MALERYCYACGAHVRARMEPHEVPGSTHTLTKLFCPSCGKLLGAVYDEELRIEKTFPAPRG